MAKIFCLNLFLFVFGAGFGFAFSLAVLMMLTGQQGEEPSTLAQEFALALGTLLGCVAGGNIAIWLKDGIWPSAPPEERSPGLSPIDD